MTKIAILADVHGNQTALEAVIDDALHEKVTDFWFLGDLIMPGPGSGQLISLLQKLTVSAWIKGNWEDCFLEGVYGQIDESNPCDIYMARLAHYQYEHLSSDDILFIKQLPLQQECHVNGLTISLSHNLPHKNYGPELMPASQQEQFDALFQHSEDIAIYAHVHHPQLRYSSHDQLIINPGSIGQPFANWPKLRTDLRAQYALLEIDDVGLANVQFKKVRYDTQLELQRATQANLPYLELYQEQLETGKTFTHNQQRLHELNKRYGYQQDVHAFFRSPRLK